MTTSLRGDTPPQGTRGLFIALGILLVLLVGSAFVAWGLSRLTSLVWPTAPAWLLLVYLALVLLPAMLFVSRAFRWIVNWYYLLPAIVVLLAFTVFPIVLTVNFAFTNYSGQNSGFPDTAYKTSITLSSDRTTLTLKELPEDFATAQQLFNCEGASCARKPIALYDEAGAAPVTLSIASIEGNTIRLSEPVPATFTPVETTRVNTINYVGLRNFQDIFKRAGSELWPVFIWTVAFAFLTIIINALFGLLLGILLYNKRLKGRNFYRTLLFLPWAIPAIISIQMWRALLDQQFGIVNKGLGLLGALPVPWLTDPDWAKVSILLVNLWLGFPYMMTATISALSTIPDDLYEAAQIDGASRFQQIQNITLPLLRNSFTPILLSGFAFNFNNFGIIYLLTRGGPAQEGRTSTAQATDILLSWGFNTAFTSAGGSNFAAASAIAVIIFILTVAISLVNFRAAGVFQEARR
ncbi:ABC transporter permease subunit [Deinococcus yavapaiensis]|uniref:Maltose/maltodextrin transport system permease protein n=1 Tax=Deinococcus yavapaiensis KR-236 TaxID=694435 RepID=A0A318SAV4_9DEIO|nr:ABC transporter permease subunit [Deinococcus yavapaiensis]PYE56509.1 carbohydrate ABC transporter membrane protein 1 (CUT1 family) [Deinococcus yavapaiensis KR-236]